MDEQNSRDTPDDQFSDGEGGLQTTLNDLLTLPIINIPYDDNMQNLAEEIDELPAEELFDTVSEITKIYGYPFDLRSYWLIDIIAELLINGKKEGLSSQNLWAMLGWFVYIFQGFKENNWTHESLMQHIQSISLASAQEIKMRDHQRTSNVSTSSAIAAHQKKASTQSIHQRSKQKKQHRWDSSVSSNESISMHTKATKKFRRTRKKSITKPEVMYTLEDLLIIVNIFYELFSNSFQFKLIQWSLLDFGQVITLDWPFSINIPRGVKPPPSPIQMPEPVKPVSPVKLEVKGKDKKTKKKGKTHSEDDKTVMEQELKQKLQQEDKEPKLEETPVNWEVDDEKYLLSLQEANGIGVDFFLALFPVTDNESLEKKQGKTTKKGEKKTKKGK